MRHLSRQLPAAIFAAIVPSRASVILALAAVMIEIASQPQQKHHLRGCYL
ncbi:hypothetical protein [Psychrobacter pygoscelis]|nr:hypothetical protein [Psychrobacter pygoscelis]